jgi:hypothetical protein
MAALRFRPQHRLVAAASPWPGGAGPERPFVWVLPFDLERIRTTWNLSKVASTLTMRSSWSLTGNPGRRLCDGCEF